MVPSAELWFVSQNLHCASTVDEKQRLHKNSSTVLLVFRQLQRKRTFTGSTVYKPFGLEASGSLSLTDYKDLAKCDAQIDHLRHCGLTEEEIQLKLASERAGLAEEELGSSTSGTKQAHLSIINQKIMAKAKELVQPTVFRGARQMTRHERQLEASISHDSEKTKLLSCLLTSKQPSDAEVDFSDPSHPMNNLDSIMHDILGSEKQLERKAEASEIVCHSSQQDAASDECAGSDIIPKSIPKYECCENCDRYNKSVKKGSQPYSDWEPVPPRNAPLPVVGCANRPDTELQTEPLSKFASAMPGAPKTLVGNVESISEEDIMKHRLSAEEIVQLPRFQNYSPGEPSKVNLNTASVVILLVNSIRYNLKVPWWHAQFASCFRPCTSGISLPKSSRKTWFHSSSNIRNQVDHR